MVAPPVEPGSRLRPRRLLARGVLLVCSMLLVLAFVVQPFQVPTGSMAPALYGHHRLCTCPRCGYSFAVGRHSGDRDGQGDAGCYRHAFCPNCGMSPIPVASIPETRGDQVLVDRTAYVLRRPERWDVAVLRLLGSFLIKRVLGLPGEKIEIREGDIYVDDALVRKSFAQARGQRVPLFDQNHAPPQVADRRWQGRGKTRIEEGYVALDGLDGSAELTYRNFLLEEGQVRALDDEYAYNSGSHAGVEPVHDFMIEADVTVEAGAGTVRIEIFDGADWANVVVPVGGGRSRASRRRLENEETLAETEVAFAVGSPYHVEVALVDRRLSCAIDSRLEMSVDLPAVRARGGVETPVRLTCDGVKAEMRNFRLYRDIHYSQRGEHGVQGRPVRLGVDQYFVLGDNSGNSEDSRFWSDEGRVPLEAFVGRAFLVHLPGRQLDGWGIQGIDPSRVRWLR